MKVRFDQSTNCCGRDRKRSLPWQPALVRHARHLAGEWRFIGEELPEQTGEGRELSWTGDHCQAPRRCLRLSRLNCPGAENKQFTDGNRPRRAVRHLRRSCDLSSLTSSAAHSRASGSFPASLKARAFARAWLSDRRSAADSFPGRAPWALRSAADVLRILLIQLGFGRDKSRPSTPRSQRVSASAHTGALVENRPCHCTARRQVAPLPTPPLSVGCSALGNHGVTPNQATDYPTRP
jgi:hypothetical protein